MPEKSDGSISDDIRSIGAIFVSVITAAIAIWWLALVAQRLGLKPEVNAEGAIVLDEYQRSKDILLVVLPLFSAALAYWVGSQGTTAAKKEAESAKDKLDAVLDASPEGVLERARQKHPDAFSR